MAEGTIRQNEQVPALLPTCCGALGQSLSLSVLQMDQPCFAIPTTANMPSIVQLKNTQIQQERIADIVDGELGIWGEEGKQRFLGLYSSSSGHYPGGAQQCLGHKEPQADMGYPPGSSVTAAGVA